MLIDQKKILLAAELLRKGEVVAFPTETVYGLGARVFDEKAIQKIYALKGRPSDNPLIVHIGREEEIELLAAQIPDDAYLLQKHFFPGPLTLVLKRNQRVPSIVSAGLPTIALRMPSHPIALKLIQTLEEPIAAPSANLSGRPSPTRREHVLEDFQEKIPLILDGGPCEWGIESTVISLVHPQPMLLRPGVIKKEEIERVLGKKIGIAKKTEAALSPGMKYRHYAPNAKIVLFEEEKELAVYLEKAPYKKREILSKVSTQSLYDDFRKADEKKVEEIIILCDPFLKNDVALMNRITHASGRHEK